MFWWPLPLAPHPRNPMLILSFAPFTLSYDAAFSDDDPDDIAAPAIAADVLPKKLRRDKCLFAMVLISYSSDNILD
jgi:hypothetical protein